MYTEEQQPIGIYDGKGTFTITQVDGTEIVYLIDKTIKYEEAYAILVLVRGYCFVIINPNSPKETYQVKYEPWTLDEGVYMLKLKNSGALTE